MALTCENAPCLSLCTIFEDTSELQRFVIARAMTGG
jgi:hypothetical protein